MLQTQTMSAVDQRESTRGDGDMLRTQTMSTVDQRESTRGDDDMLQTQTMSAADQRESTRGDDDMLQTQTMSTVDQRESTRGDDDMLQTQTMSTADQRESTRGDDVMLQTQKEKVFSRSLDNLQQTRYEMQLQKLKLCHSMSGFSSEVATFPPQNGGNKEKPLQVNTRTRKKSSPKPFKSISLNNLDETGSGESDWENEADQLFTSYIGQAKFEQLKATQFEVAQRKSSGIFSTIGGKLQEIGYNLTHKTTLTDTFYPQSPRPVGGSGYVKVVSNPRYPDHPVFKAGRIFQVCLRHNNLSYENDTRLDGHVTCLRLTEPSWGEPIDFIMHTGKVPQYHSADTFNEFRAAFQEGTDSLKLWTYKQPMNYYSRVENVRRKPVSFYDQRYYTQVTYMFTCLIGAPRLARMRLLPADGSKQSGLPEKTDQETVWDTRSRKSESASASYLRDEYIKRLTACPLQYRWQIQTRPFPPDAVVSEEDENEANTETNTERNTETKMSLNFRAHNCCIEWSEEVYPWIDFAIVTITTPVAEHALAKVPFNLTNSLPSFKPSTPDSIKDLTLLVTLLREFHGVDITNICPNEEDRILYKIGTQTGRHVDAGTDSDIYITITGSSGQTRPISLDKLFRDDFEPGQMDVFEVKAVSVGEILSVEIRKKKSLNDRCWLLNEVTVEDVNQSKPIRFPCYQWITSKHPCVVLSRPDAISPQAGLSIQPYLQRKCEIALRRNVYQWESRPGLPGRFKLDSYADLPQELLFRREKDHDLHERFRRNAAALGINRSLNLFGWNILEDNRKLMTGLMKQKEGLRQAVNNWDSDEELGRQFLNGAHPNRIERVKKLPSDFHSKWDVIGEMMEPGHTLGSELNNGRVFIATYPELDKLASNSDKNGGVKHILRSPTCLLYARRDGRLLPIAIVLSQGRKQPVWTPRDAAPDWLLAKMWLRNADAHVHLVCSRFLHTKVVMEAVALATLRNLPSAHPVHKLLMPHLKHILAIGVLNRKNPNPHGTCYLHRLLTVGRDFESILRNSYRYFSLKDLHIPKALRVRGVLDRDVLPAYFYRDDALALWEIIRKFTRTVLILHYWNSSEVARDHELSDWIQDLNDNGLPNVRPHDKRSLVISFEDINEVIEFVTLVIFTSSCQLSAVSAGLLDTYGYIPNAPSRFTSYPPTEKGVTMRDILSSLPNKPITGEIITACYTLSQSSKDQVLLGEFSEMMWSDEPTRAAIVAFQEDLRALEVTIEERNKHLEVPYTYLLPSRITKSVLI